MSDYLSLASCKGRRPRYLTARTVTTRPHIITRLLGERHVARFLVAPTGYGKTSIAMEYAQTVFDYTHVSWLDARSPCFFRELDKGSLAEEIMQRDASVGLVVIDELPRMGTARTDEVSRCIDVWLSQGCEVLITAVPSCDAFARRQPDRIILSATDLLLPEEEAPEDVDAACEGSAPFNGMRIAQLAWGGAEGLDAFAEGLAAEQLPNDLMLLLFVVLVLGACDAKTVRQLCQKDYAQTLESLGRSYPHLGYNPATGSFNAVRLPIASVAKAFRGAVASFVETTGSEDDSTFLLEIAEVLLSAKEYDRANDLLRALATAPARKSWLAAHGMELLECMAIRSLCQLVDRLKLTSDAEGAHLALLRTLAWALLGRMQEACTTAARWMTLAYTRSEDADTFALLLLHVGNAAQRQKAQMYCSLAEHDLPPLLDIQLALTQNVSQVELLWEKHSNEGAPQRVMALAATWALPALPTNMVPAVANYLSGLEAAQANNLVDHLIIKAAREEEETRRTTGLVPFDLVMVLYSCETALSSQRYEYLEYCQKARGPKASSPAAGAQRQESALAYPAEILGNVPRLYVRLYGGMEVTVGGAHVDPAFLKRRRLRTLLGILVLNAGHELSRDKLVSSMWPLSPPESGTKNLYSLWCTLRKMLKTTDGRCPYLYHVQGGYKLQERFVDSDVKRINAICGILRYGAVDETGWQQLLTELEELTQGELLPGENESNIVVAAREEYQAKVSAALIIGAERLLKDNKPRVALWLAEAAFRRDKNREDCYYVLMAAQYACGQPGAALQTYFLGKRFSIDALGIDPSTRMVNLYRRILEENEDF
ncbi:MAG: BTAD domain-containing putative transcriptional regulator [Coriobacteriia bacterium]|nr:BTAD domain-containing putative transcriptional regulator [Coriobacteriia bacterium]